MFFSPEIVKFRNMSYFIFALQFWLNSFQYLEKNNNNQNTIETGSLQEQDMAEKVMKSLNYLKERFEIVSVY